MADFCFRRGGSEVSPATLVLLLLFLQTNAMASGQTPPLTPDLATIVQRLTQAEWDNRARARAYSLTREYKVFGANADHPRTHVVATVNFLPPNLKTYDIDQSTGGMGEKVVRHILDREMEATSNPAAMMVTEQNYDFTFAGEDVTAGRPCYRLDIAPKQQRKNLLKATVWVDKDSYRILRIEGEPVKSPSFWVKDIHLTLDFGEISGMWMQIESHSFARMRFGGEYKVTSQNLNYAVASSVAVNTRPTPPQHRHSAVIANDMR